MTIPPWGISASVIRVTLDCGPDVSSVDTDELRFRQVVVNLLSNAVKFTPDGGTVLVRARVVGNQLLVSVADSGIGVQAADRERIFESFQQGGRGPSSEEGTGLGLTLSRRIVELFGGRLWLEVDESVALAQREQVQEFGRLLRPLGVRLGLEHAGQRLHQIERLYELGLDYVKLDASVCRGVARSDASREFVRSTVTLLHALSVVVHAEAVADDADAQVLFDCGIDAVTGPWASERHKP